MSCRSAVYTLRPMHCRKQTSAWTELSPIFWNWFVLCWVLCGWCTSKQSLTLTELSPTCSNHEVWLAVYCAAAFLGSKRHLLARSSRQFLPDMILTMFPPTFNCTIWRKNTRHWHPKWCFLLSGCTFEWAHCKGHFWRPFWPNTVPRFWTHFHSFFQIVCSMFFKHFLGRSTSRD